jgi:protein SCO1/2
MSRKTSIAVPIIVVIVAAIAGMLLSRALTGSQDGAEPVALASGLLLEPARPLPPISLIDHEGAPFDNARMGGQWSFLFFGFTNCPDVCPTTMRMLAQTESLLADLPGELRPRVILVSVDAKRDTPEQLASYVKFFNPEFVGLTGEQGDLEAFATRIGVPVALTPDSSGGYTVDHGAAIFVVEPSGALRALFTPPHDARAIAADYRRIVGATAQ